MAGGRKMAGRGNGASYEDVLSGGTTTHSTTSYYCYYHYIVFRVTTY